MTTRLANLVSQATDVDGHLDRAKLYELLSLAPDDPVAICIEAFLATENSRRLMKADLVEEHAAAEAALRRVAEDIADIAAEHSEHMAAAAAELKASREAAEKQMATHLAALADQGDKFEEARKSFRESALSLRLRTGWLVFLVGILTGTGATLGIMLYFR